MGVCTETTLRVEQFVEAAGDGCLTAAPSDVIENFYVNNDDSVEEKGLIFGWVLGWLLIRSVLV